MEPIDGPSLAQISIAQESEDVQRIMVSLNLCPLIPYVWGNKDHFD